MVIKGILKALFSFISWLLNFSDLPMAQIWGKDLQYGYGAPSSLFGVKSPQPFDTPFDSLRWAPLSLVYTYVLAKLLRNGAKFIQKLIPDFKNHRNLDNSRQAVNSPKSHNSMGYIYLKTASLQLKHYIQKIYLGLLSTTCVKIHQIPYAIFEIISYFSRHNSSISF